MINLNSILAGELTVDNIQINTQDCNQNTLLFYNLNSSKNVEQFKQRLGSIQYAACVVNYYSEELKELKKLIIVDDNEFLLTQKKCLEKFYPVSFDNLKIIGVTGTNGKTTSVHLVNQIANALGHQVVSVGTLGVMQNLKLIKDLGATSPSFVDNWKILSDASKQKSIVAFEVSSHALEQGRFFQISFDVAMWTSFSQDHLDYHKSMEDYFNAKLKVVNLLKPDGKLLISADSTNIVEKLESHPRVTIVPTMEALERNSFFKPVFNRINLSLVLQALKLIGISPDEDMLAQLTPPPGRFNVISCQSNEVIIDYAHTPDAIENIAKAIRQAYPEKKLVTIFGCGGNRDRTKRPLMGKAAATYSDKVVVTSDNPRNESPKAIIDDIMPGIPSSTLAMIEEDRKKAIWTTLENEKDAIILIAGKGHEDTMEIAGKKFFFSDESVVKEFIHAHS